MGWALLRWEVGSGTFVRSKLAPRTVESNRPVTTWFLDLGFFLMFPCLVAFRLQHHCCLQFCRQMPQRVMFNGGRVCMLAQRERFQANHGQTHSWATARDRVLFVLCWFSGHNMFGTWLSPLAVLFRCCSEWNVGKHMCSDCAKIAP